MPLEEKALRIRMIGDVMRGVGLMSNYVPDATMLGLLEGGEVINAELDRIVEELRKEQEEKRMQNRVQPMPAPSSQRPW